jgi:hypothetical protein
VSAIEAVRRARLAVMVGALWVGCREKLDAYHAG